jgi:uncharacterized membrane protein
MGWIKTVASEIYGLFVDDVSFAVAILAWLLFVWLALSRLGIGSAWMGSALFAGLAMIFVESATRRARR